MTTTFAPELRQQWEPVTLGREMPFGVVTVRDVRYWVVVNGHVLVATRTEDTEPLFRATDNGAENEKRIVEWLSREVNCQPVSLAALKAWAGEYVSDDEADRRAINEQGPDSGSEPWEYDSTIYGRIRQMTSRYAWLYGHGINQNVLAHALKYLDQPEVVAAGWFNFHPRYNPGVRRSKVSTDGRAFYVLAPDWTVMAMGLADHAGVADNAPRFPAVRA